MTPVKDRVWDLEASKGSGLQVLVFGLKAESLMLWTWCVGLSAQGSRLRT